MNDDLSVIQRVLAGEPDAFRALVRRHQDSVWRLIRNFMNDPNDVEDIAQEVFLTAYRNLVAYDPDQGAFAPWLLAIARHKCLNALKKHRPRVLPRLPEEGDPHTPDRALTQAEWFRQLDAALDSMPLEQKTVFLLAEIEELSHEEIGRIEGIPVGTVKSRLSRAKEKLRSYFRTVEQP
jgi:RNA polymerase sigma-70 factor (ECF subfamily)